MRKPHLLTRFAIINWKLVGNQPLHSKAGICAIVEIKSGKLNIEKWKSALHQIRPVMIDKKILLFRNQAELSLVPFEK